MTRETEILPVALVLIILSLSSFLGCGRDQGESLQAATDREPVIPVTVARAVEKDVTVFMTFTGKITAFQDVTICSKVGGILEEAPFEEGDRVEGGQTLARVEDEEYVLGLREAEAALSSARSQFAKTRQLSRPQEIGAARAAYERAQADFNKARITWERRRQLYEKGVISKQEHDIAKLDYQSRMAARDAVKKEFDLVKEGARPEDIETAGFQVKQAEARLALAKKRLDDTRIKSPISGIITRKMADPGDLVALGTPIGNVVDMTKVETEVGVTEKDLPYLRRESSVTATVVAYPDRIFAGRIVFIGVKADDVTGTFPVKVEFDNPSGLLKSGMVAEVKIERETYQDVVTIPQDAVLDKVNRKVVFVIEDGRSLERSVQLGPFVEGEVIVKKGLTAGETFVVVGQQRLKHGITVRIEGKA